MYKVFKSKNIFTDRFWHLRTLIHKAKFNLKFLFHNIRECGFTLAETIVVVGVFGLLMVLISGLVANFYKQNEYALQQSSAISGARNAVSVLVQDLREAIPSQSGAYPLELIKVDEIIFYSDIDRDDEVERARYYVNHENQLIKETIEPSGNPAQYHSSDSESKIVANYIVNDLMDMPMFTYFDKNGHDIIDLSDVDSVRFIELNVVVNVDPNRQPDEFILRSSAYLRNLQPTLQ